MKKAALKAIKAYQKTVGVRTHFFRTFFLMESSCRYSPTCSDYFYKAVEKYGVIRGSVKGIGRILRCHPWSKGGFDPIT